MESNHKRYCSSCRMYKPVDGGKFAGPRNQHWRCAKCVAKVVKRTQVTEIRSEANER